MDGSYFDYWYSMERMAWCVYLCSGMTGELVQCYPTEGQARDAAYSN